MSTSPLGQRAKLKGPQVHKRILMKPQASSYLLQVKLPAALQRTLHNAAQQSTIDNAAAGSGLTVAKSLQHVPTVRLPQFSNDELANAEYMSSYRGVVTVTVTSAASCNEVISVILQSVGYYERSASDYQLIQCFADFSPDHTRRRLTGDSDGTPIKTVMQFPFHLALTLSPFVVLRDQLVFETEPEGRASIHEAYRDLFMFFLTGYQTLLHRMMEQYHFLEGREAEGRRGKKYEERQQFFELVRFRTLQDEKNERRLVLNMEHLCRESQICEHLVVSEKLVQLHGSSHRPPLQHGWLLEHAAFLSQLRNTQNSLLSQQTLKIRLCQRFEDLDRFSVRLFGEYRCEKERWFTLCRLSRNMHDAIVNDTSPEVVEDRRRKHSEQSLPQIYNVAAVANTSIVCGDFFAKSRHPL